ncbi:peroxiredoxin [Cysteiniphilum halobium]|uniref:peroxiredoxin n=1 Tax=Cysteiniphilum halobium TaxID=2219059 RepID=UPI000E657AAD|nr:peroxiredoxin [Cysteiniphilum halobium]
MSIQLGDSAPNFKAKTTLGEIDFHKWIGDSWCVLFSHPKDFTPVCTTELGVAAKLKPKFENLNCKVIALSVDTVDEHKEWIKDINETQNTTVNYPIIDDSDTKVSTLYNMIHANASDTLTVRSVFIIDPHKKVRLTFTYPASTGRNFDEILRVIESLQLTDKYSLATPVNWKKGDQCVIVPSVTNEQAEQMFKNGFEEIKPYLRLTDVPA